LRPDASFDIFGLWHMASIAPRGSRAATASRAADGGQQWGLKVEFMDPVPPHREKRASQFQ